MPAIAVDALDPVAVYRVAYEAILRARQGRGATLLKCSVHPSFHCTPTPDNSERPANLPLSFNSVFTMETYLRRKGIEPDQHSRQIVAEFNRELNLATRFLDR
jgi:TPP-dependent pyruvate/acetoin dehydrogenase alpha subunit